MTKAQLPPKQIYLPSIISNVTNKENELWNTGLQVSSSTLSIRASYISSRFFKNQPNEICSRREKNNGCPLNFFNSYFWPEKNCWTQKVHLVITFSKILLEHPSKWAATSKWHSLKDWQNYLETSSRFLKPYLTKFAVIWVKRRQKADFLSPRSSKIVGTKEKERSKSEEKERRRRVKSNGCTLSFYNSYFGQKKMLNVKGPFGNTF